MPTDKMAERVLVVPAARLDAAGRFTGFRAYDPAFAKTILDASFYEFRPRGEVETDPAFLQLIPYVVLKWRDQVFAYTRTGGGETRLDLLRSIGIGGHISAEDASAGGDVYRVGMEREVREEVEIDSPFSEETAGFIYDPSTAVGEVHLGVVHVWKLAEPLAFAREEGIEEAAFAPLRELLHQRSHFETWSRLAMERLAGG